MAEEEAATREHRGEMRQWQVARDECAGAGGAKRCERCLVGLAADEHELRRRAVRAESRGDGGPAFDGPVFPRAAAAGVDGDARALDAAKKPRGGGMIGGVRMNGGRVILEIEREALERAGELVRGVRGVVDLRECGEEILHASPPEIGLEEPARVVEKTHHLLEAGEVFDEVRREFAAGDEEAGHRCVFDRTRGVRVEAVFGERDDVLVAEDLQMRAGERLTQEFDRRQREDEVADGPATDDEDAWLHGLSGLRGRSVSATTRIEPAESTLPLPLLRPVPRDIAHAIRILRLRGRAATERKEKGCEEKEREESHRHAGIALASYFRWPS